MHGRFSIIGGSRARIALLSLRLCLHAYCVYVCVGLYIMCAYQSVYISSDTFSQSHSAACLIYRLYNKEAVSAFDTSEKSVPKIYCPCTFAYTCTLPHRRPPILKPTSPCKLRCVPLRR